MRKTTIFTTVFSLVFAVLAIYFTVYLLHMDQKIDHIYRPTRLFSPTSIESPDLSKSDFPDTMTPALNKFCYIFCQQSLSWMHKGEHCYVFSTHDGRHVVKFLPLKMAKRRLSQAVLSSQLAFDEIPEETGLKFFHFNRTVRVSRGIALDDFYGQRHRIIGDHTRFIVQERATPFFPMLASLIRAGKIEEAKKRIDQVMDLLYVLAQKKISDGDDESFLNEAVGFTEDRAIYLDTWHFSHIPFIDVSSRMKYELKVRMEPLRKWLSFMSPELAQYFVDRRNQFQY